MSDKPAIMIKFGQQLRDNTQGEITMADFEKAWEIQRVELGLPTEIGEHEVGVKNRYDGLSDEELILQLETLTAKYKEKLSSKRCLLRHKKTRLSRPGNPALLSGWLALFSCETAPIRNVFKHLYYTKIIPHLSNFAQEKTSA